MKFIVYLELLYVNFAVPAASHLWSLMTEI